MVFRSEQMQHFQLIIPRQKAWDVTNEMGRLGIIHLEDISNPMLRPFTSQVKRCEEALNRISMIIKFMNKKGINHQKYPSGSPENTLHTLMQKWEAESESMKTNPIKRIDIIQDQIDKAWNTYQQLTLRLDRFNSSFSSQKGKIAVYSVSGYLLGGNYLENRQPSDFPSIQNQDNIRSNGLQYSISIIQPEDEARIAKMIFRVSKGYAWANFVHKEHFHHILELNNFNYTILILLYPNSAQGMIRKKLQKIVESFSVETFKLPATFPEFERQKAMTYKSYSESQQLLTLLNNQTNTFLDLISKKQKLDEWQLFLTKQRKLYETLNKMEIKDQFVIAKFYIPSSKVRELDKITLAMAPAPILHNIPLARPPSYFETNLFTYPGQQIVQTYGVPRYEQMNPGVFTCITFPFLFGVMFGDIAHGFVLLMFGIFLTFFPNLLKNSALKSLLQVRYMIVLMGFFAMYCGFIYNDFMGMGLNLFGSCYIPPMYPHDGQIIVPNKDCVYKFGVDPIWYRTQNQLMFMNSLKMKLAVIIGVIHMSFGIVLKAVNSLHFKKNLDFFFQFIPQIIFLVLMFGYMDFLIVFKWLKYWPQEKIVQAPSIITLLINIPLKLGKTTQQFGGRNLWGNSPTDTSQNTIQLAILLISVACIPIMLIPKPWIEISRINRHKLKKYIIEEKLLDQNLRQSEALTHFEPLKQNEDDEQAHMQSSQIIVHQIIQTIQFVLGCISNTASYLRLWALSLAHSQLSQVFFNKTIQSGFNNGYSSIMMLILGFYVLAYVTFGVLLCMDTMQCFLHALRLHWVQFQNKFYKADGSKFIAFSFDEAIKQFRQSQQ